MGVTMVPLRHVLVGLAITVIALTCLALGSEPADHEPWNGCFEDQVAVPVDDNTGIGGDHVTRRCVALDDLGGDL